MKNRRSKRSGKKKERAEDDEDISKRVIDSIADQSVKEEDKFLEGIADSVVTAFFLFLIIRAIQYIVDYCGFLKE